MTPTYLWVILVPLVVVQSYLVLYDEACKLIGQRLASQEYLRVNKDGFKTALMDHQHNKWFFLVSALIIGAGGWLLLAFGWVTALVGAVIWFVVGVVCRVFFFPKKDSRHFIMLVFASMSRRYADYVRDGDVTRAAAMSALLEGFSESYGAIITKEGQP